MEVRLCKVLLVLVVVLAVTAQKAEKLTQNPCTVKQTCHECIQTPTCAWCAQPRGFENRKRCFQHASASANLQCDQDFLYNPDNEYHIDTDKNLGKHISYNSTSSSASSSSSSSSSSTSSQNEAVQISPQKVSLKLRINEAYNMDFAYAQAEDYPVDLYYLMDLSKSMEDDKQKLSGLGGKLASSMQKITSNFRLGFGSFVDKVVMPYVSTVPKKLMEPCDKCEAPYGFRNHMKLTIDTASFSANVANAAVSGNLDAPEGGFDAIMQAIVCKNDIGWREKARHLLVFSTDAGFHYAGDGKLGGIVKPNDGMCHLGRDGLYTHSTLQDYPSISQINLKVKKNAINMIFAVTKEQYNVYERLSKHIEGSTSGTLEEDSSNVVELVKNQYNKIRSSVEMKDTATNAVKVTYYSNCLNPDGPMEETNKCDGLMVGTKVNFQAKIEVKECPKNQSEWKQQFSIYPVGISESLIVDLEMLCSCPCEQEGHPGYEKESPNCSGSGTYKCGICECDVNHFGRICECGSDMVRQGDKEQDMTATCRPDNTSSICSGRGNCVCGQCDCEPRANPEEKISGPFCECDNFSCDRHNGLLCSGPEHGTCVCGKCVCKPEWTGKACDCLASKDTCLPPGGGEICSGHGVCECGACKCHQNEQGHYSGRYCDKCPTCPGRCQELKDCVYCQMYKKDQLTEECSNCTFVPLAQDVVEDREDLDENFCTYYDDEDCRYAFIYKYDDQGKIVVIAQQERDCPPQVHVLAIVLGVIGAIVLIGLALLLLWKLVTTIHDRREFARFEKERSMAKWDTGENPIYRQATSTFKNPTYAGK